jgi:hypothetical protein
MARMKTEVNRKVTAKAVHGNNNLLGSTLDVVNNQLRPKNIVRNESVSDDKE